MVNNMDFNKILTEKQNEAENIIDSYLPKDSSYQTIVIEAMNYSIKAGGKRIRPILMQEAYEIFGGRSNIIMPFMAGMEMLHTYSLIHDDLPAMDNDDYRRGRETTHKVFGEAMAILAGDGLLNYAYETAIKSFDLAKNNSEFVNSAKALKIFMEKAGVYGMVGGQTADVINEGKAVSMEELDFIFRLKTGALIEACLMMGAVLAGASREQVDAMEKVGSNIGRAFQIKDDILDVIGDEKIIGKPVLSDEKNNKTTYVTLYGLEKAQEDVTKLTDEAIAIIRKLEDEGAVSNTEFFVEFANMLINRNK